MAGSLTEAIAALVGPIVERRGADLEGVSTRKAGRRTVVVIVVDADGGVALDDVAAISRDVSATLDEAGTMGQTSYTLEVTSPGVDRPLTQPRHWRRNRGRLVRVLRTDGSTVSGRIADSDEQSATLSVADQHVTLGWQEVDRAVVQVEFPKEAG